MYHYVDVVVSLVITPEGGITEGWSSTSTGARCSALNIGSQVFHHDHAMELETLSAYRVAPVITVRVRRIATDSTLFIRP